MSNEVKNLLDSIQQLLPVFVNNRSESTKLTDSIRMLNALVDDLGHDMNDEMQLKWIDRMAEAVSDCDRNIYGLPEGVQRLCTGALRALEGRFYEAVEKDNLAAGKCYEEAAKTINLISKDLLLSEVKSLFVQEGVSEEDAEKLLPALFAPLLEPPDVSLLAVSL